jgi:hypothetical protein
MNVTKSNIVIPPFTVDTATLPCEPTEVSAEFTVSLILFYIREMTTITFTTVVEKTSFEPRGTVTVTLPEANLTLDGLETLINAKSEVVISFAPGNLLPPAAAVGALALGGGLKRRSSRRPPRRAS